MSSLKLYEFDPQIYTRKLWVAKYGTVKEIQDLFYNAAGEEIEFGDRTDIGAWTCGVERKEDGRLGVVVWFPKKITVNYMAHEGTHAMHYYCDMLGLEMIRGSDNEHLAYLMGWICDCINSARLNLIEPINIKKKEE